MAIIQVHWCPVVAMALTASCGCDVVAMVTSQAVVYQWVDHPSWKEEKSKYGEEERRGEQDLEIEAEEGRNASLRQRQ